LNYFSGGKNVRLFMGKKKHDQSILECHGRAFLSKKQDYFFMMPAKVAPICAGEFTT